MSDYRCEGKPHNWTEEGDWVGIGACRVCRDCGQILPTDVAAENDLTERLRRLVIFDEVGSDNPLGREAADEIDRLREEIERIKDINQQQYDEGYKHGLNARLGPSFEHVQELRAEIDRLREDFTASSARIALLTTERDEAVQAFATAILHGDDEHRAWLSESAAAFVAGEPLPPPNGRGRAEAAEARIALLTTENTRLRAALAQSDQPCAYCTLPAAEWNKCQSGFPGCDRADDAMGCPELGAGLQVALLTTERDRVRDALTEVREIMAASYPDPQRRMVWAQQIIDHVDAALPPAVGEAAISRPPAVGEGATIPIETLRWWRELVDLNPKDLAPRMDAYLNELKG